MSIISENGIVNGTLDKYESGKSYALEASPDDGYIFDGWYLDGQMLSSEPTIDFKPQNDMVLEARFSLITTTYGVSVHYDDFSIEWGSVEDGFPVSELNIENVFVKPNHEYLDFYVGIFLEDTYNGKFSTRANVVLSSLDEGEWVYISGDNSIWYKRSSSLVEATKLSELGNISSHVDVTPVFIPIYYTVTLILGNGQNNIILEYTHNQTFDYNTTPVRDGFTFNNWRLSSINGSVFSVGTPITGNIVLYATWTENSSSNHYPYVGTYYNDIDFNNFNTIEEAELLDLLELQVPKSYGTTPWIPNEASCEDLDNSNNIISFYTGESMRKDDHVSGSNGWNNEHVWPQSRMPKSIAGDLHNLWACDAGVNSSRGDKTFVDSSGSYKSVGTNNYYPGDEWIGEVARTLMYMAFRYNGFNGVNNGSNGGKIVTISSLSQLVPIEVALRWHEDDPVSEWEMRRNNILYNDGHWGNRNPFVDHPELAQMIYGNQVRSSSRLETSFKDNIIICILENKKNIFFSKGEIA